MLLSWKHKYKSIKPFQLFASQDKCGDPPRHGCVFHKMAFFLAMAVSLRTQGTQRQERELLTTVPEETAMDICRDPSSNQSYS